MLKAEHVVIVGGGFTGTLLAINLLRHGTRQVTLIERDIDRLGRGVAYGTARAEHVLNVRAANMSAFPDKPHHFAEWLVGRGAPAAATFATRRDYGSYLAQLLDAARRSSAERLHIVSERAARLETSDAGARVTLTSGAVIPADVVVLACGNLPPHDLPDFAGLPDDVYLGDPWAGDMTRGLASHDMVLLLGNGPTAIDGILTLAASGFEGRIVSLSRRGLVPRSHASATPFEPRRDRPAEIGAALVRDVRNRAGEIGWRNAVDELRPFTPDIWRAADAEMRARFLRHLRPYWDVHRHRLAPQVAQTIEQMRRNGRLSVLAGKIRNAAAHGTGLAVRWRPRGGPDAQTLHVRRAVNCTGPLGDLSRTDDPLLRQAQQDGLLRPDALAVGIDVDREGRAVARHGAVVPRLFVAGPMTRGTHWEIVAVPDIRKQVWDMARYLSNSHWVGAEGL